MTLKDTIETAVERVRPETHWADFTPYGPIPNWTKESTYLRPSCPSCEAPLGEKVELAKAPHVDIVGKTQLYPKPGGERIPWCFSCNEGRST